MQPLGTETKNKTSLVCGHRGASGHAPENTIAAFREALEAGATWIEFDVQLTADGEVIVLHDNYLERTTDLKQRVRPSTLTLAGLKKLDAGSWFGPGFAGERIPTLDEVLEEFKGKLGFNVEIKSRPTVEPDNEIEVLVAQKLARHNLHDISEVIVSSFDPIRLAALHAYDERLPLGALYDPKDHPRRFDPFLLIPMTGARAFHPKHTAINEALLERARKQGLMVNTWTVNEIPDMLRMIELGIDIIITNYPAQLREVIEARSNK